MIENELIPHLFRTEYRKIISVLCKLFGIEHIEIAEDIVSDTFLLASETWGQKGIPKNPTAWLYQVSKNKTLDLLKHDKIFKNKIWIELKRKKTQHFDLEVDLSPKNITDSQLQMMFAICNPNISSKDQICLSLNILCGFGAEEIANAFLIRKEVLYKRLSRAKVKLRSAQIKIEIPSKKEINSRLSNVLTTLYLMFSEGYYSASQNTTLRKDLCVEAMRLTLMLTKYPQTKTPETYALLSLMCFHSSRFEARINKSGGWILYDDQDEKLWNHELIEKGNYFLNKSSYGKYVSKYHLEAAIAFWHTKKKDNMEKWSNILKLYDQLLKIEYSPFASLNRIYVIFKLKGEKPAIKEAAKIRPTHDHLYHSLLAELYKSFNTKKQIEHLELALALVKNNSDKAVLDEKLKLVK